MGNVGSIKNMLKYVGYSSVVSNDPSVIKSASKLIIAGVGAFDAGIRNFENLMPLVDEKVRKDQIPILGICLGMQLFSKSSEEGVLPGFGWINAKTIRFDFRGADRKLRIPHMGWNSVTLKKKASKLFVDMPENPRFYFVHSYHYSDIPDEDVLTTTPYGNDFASAVEKENIFGVQFHPEKSHKFGMKLLENFAKMV
jgi:glutamine amidotransferase